MSWRFSTRCVDGGVPLARRANSVPFFSCRLNTNPRHLEAVAQLIRHGHTQLGRDVLWGIRQELEAGEDPLPWIDAVQTMRDAGALTDDAASYLIVIVAEAAAFKRCDSDTTIQDLTKRMDEIERREGLTEDEAFRLGEGPPDYEVLRKRWDVRFESLQAAILRQAGENEMALEILRDEDAHRSRTERGWLELMAQPGEAD